MKTYKAKSSVSRAAKKEFGADWKNLGSVEENADGFFFLINGKEAVVKGADGMLGQKVWPSGIITEGANRELVAQYGVCECPSCGINLSNGVDTAEAMLHDSPEDKVRIDFGLAMKKAFLCMACDEEFGPDLPAEGAQAQPEPLAKKQGGNKSTILTPCAVVWEVAEAGILAGKKRKDIIAECVEMGINFYTARTQYQKYTEAAKNSK